jgi:hypothetical protein
MMRVTRWTSKAGGHAAGIVPVTDPVEKTVGVVGAPRGGAEEKGPSRGRTPGRASWSMTFNQKSPS